MRYTNDTNKYTNKNNTKNIKSLTYITQTKKEHVEAITGACNKKVKK